MKGGDEMRSYGQILGSKRIKKRPKFTCRYCDKPAVFDVQDQDTGKLMGLMCVTCCEKYFEETQVQRWSVKV